MVFLGWGLIALPVGALLGFVVAMLYYFFLKPLVKKVWWYLKGF